ncbi:MAG TPA: ACP S-malonyltransferase [Burkholderiales bacterium]|nr:ACP S-malonyltransferase [Burkholderiales bacterium]
MKVAFVFPGQGSQAVGMMRGFAGSSEVRAVFDEASSALGQDLWTLVEQGPAEELNSTVNTQPVMLTAGYAIYRAWRAAGGPEPDLVAGHSLGEYTALVAAGALAFRDAVPLVRIRAQAMQEAVPIGEGAMAAILGLDDEALKAACNDAAQGQVVEPVNFNAPSQVVIAGHKAAVERGMALAKARGARRAIALPVSAPFHSSLLRPAADRLARHLAAISVNAPRIPVVNNVDVAIESNPQRIRDALARQACGPVRWVEVVRRLAQSGAGHVVECGPGNVLAALTRRIEDRLQGHSISDPASLGQTLEKIRL